MRNSSEEIEDLRKVPPGRFRRVLREYLRPYLWKVGVSSLCMLLLTLLLMPQPLLTGIVIDRAIPNRDTSLLLRVLVIFVCIHILRALLSWAMHYSINFVGHRINFHVRKNLYAKLHELQMAYHDQQLVGKIMARVTGDVGMIQNMFGVGLITIFSDMVTMAVVVFFMFFIDWRLAAVALVLLPLYAINFRFFNSRIRAVQLRLRRKVSEIYAILAERIDAVKVVKSFAKESAETNNFRRRIREHFSISRRNIILGSHLTVIAGTISGVGGGLLLLVGAYLIQHGAFREPFAPVVAHSEWFKAMVDRFGWQIGPLTAGWLVAMYGYIGHVYGPIVRLTQVNTTIQQAMVSVHRVFNILDTEVTVRDDPDAIEPDRLKGNVAFHDVSFKYELNSEYSLRNLNLSIPAGTVVGVVGPSGAGKSTLLSLVPRLYEVCEGMITIDGIDVSKMKISALRRAVGFVPQESLLFSGTIRDNIAYGNPRATDADVVAAARAAEAHGFICELSDGYRTQIGQRGTMLSGGQKQRLSLARALLTNPRILLLDDCTSALDSKTEASIQRTLEKLMRDRTCFVVSHRVSSVARADLIIVLNDGRIVEQGTHRELIRRDGLYARMFYERRGERQIAA